MNLTMKTKVKVTQSLRPQGLYSPWNSPGQNTGVGSLSLLRGIFPTQGSIWVGNQLSHKGSPRILEWVAYPFSSGSSQPRNRTRVSCTAGRFFTNELPGNPSKIHRAATNTQYACYRRQHVCYRRKHFLSISLD